MLENQIKLAELINGLGIKKGGSPFFQIPDTAGIYKIFVRHEDKDKIKFGAARTVNGKPFCPPRKVNGKLRVTTVDDAGELQKNYESIGDDTIYIGKSDSSLRERLRLWAKMAFGGHGHAGGVDMFAIQDYDKYLCVTWSKLDSSFKTAKAWKTAELKKFKDEHGGQVPLANRNEN